MSEPERFLRLIETDTERTRRDGVDPEYTAQEISVMSGWSYRETLEALIGAGIGRSTMRYSDEHGSLQKTKVVLLSELMKFADEFKWLK